MTKIIKFSPILLILILITSCAEEIDHSLSTNLSGVWQIEHLHSNNAFVKENYNVNILDDENGVQINHCKVSETLYFYREEHFLANKADEEEKLHIVNPNVIESKSVPNIISLKRTDKTNFFNAGSVDIFTADTGPDSTTEGVCAQRIVTSEDQPNEYKFQISFPYLNSYMEFEIQYKEQNIDELVNIKSFTITSPMFNQTYFRSKFNVVSGEINQIHIDDSQAHFTFDVVTGRDQAPTGPSLSGQFQVNF